MCTAELLVCVLSVLTTVLLGFNVWSAINANGKIKEIRSDMDERMNRMHDEFKDLQQLTNDRLAEETAKNNNQLDTQGRAFINLERSIIASRAQTEEDFVLMLVSMPESNSFPQAISHAITALDCWATIGNFDEASACVELITQLEGTVKLLDEKDKEKYQERVKNVPSQRRIKGIEQLYVIFNTKTNK